MLERPFLTYMEVCEFLSSMLRWEFLYKVEREKKIQPANKYENIELPAKNSREHIQELHP